MPFADNGISKYVCFLKTTCIIQICLGIMLIICGGLTVAYTQGQTVDKRPFCYAAMFVCGAMMIAAGIVSVLLQRKEDSLDILEQGPCLVYIEHVLCVFLCFLALAGLFLCAASGLASILKDCQGKLDSVCHDTKTRTEMTALTNMVLLLASAIVSFLCILCGCKYGRYFGVERQCCPVSRQTRIILEEPALKTGRR